MERQTQRHGRGGRSVLLALLLALLALFFLLSLFGFNAEDSLYFSPKPRVHPRHFLGKPGAAASSALLYYYGRSAFLLLFFFFYISYTLLRRNYRERRTGLIILAFSTVLTSSVFFSLLHPLPLYRGGGILGNFFAEKLLKLKHLGRTGSIALFSVVFFGVLLFLLKFPVKITARIASHILGGFFKRLRDRREERASRARSRGGLSHRAMPIDFSREPSGGRKPAGKAQFGEDLAGGPFGGVMPREGIFRVARLKERFAGVERVVLRERKPPLIRKVSYAENGSIDGRKPPDVRREEQRPKGEPGSVNVPEAPVNAPAHDAKGQYILPVVGEREGRLPGSSGKASKLQSVLPDASFLRKSKIANKKERDKEIQKKAQELERTLRDFGIEAKVIGITRGPVITRYELQPAPGVKLSRIVNLSDNIALSLSANGVRIEAPIPGRSAVGIEIPNDEREMVTFGDIIQEADIEGDLPLLLGRNITGRVVVADLAAMPHLLIAGATGSGKSVCVNSLIMSLLFSKSVNEVRFIMIDPKMVELKIYNGIPHLLTEVVTDPRDAAKALRWVIREMENRYRILDENFVRDIKGYNQKAKERIPSIVVIVDEFATLMAVSQKDVDEAVVRLAAMSRAVGIHLIMATQRPSVDVITGIIKANFSYRIAFQVASKTDSRTILDSIGAEKLLGRGDMLFSPAGSMNIQRIQGAYITEEEVHRVVQDLKKIGSPEYIDGIFSEDQGDGFEFGEDDPMFDEAVEIVMKTKRASASFLQRRLKIGYNRAARLIELMEEKGIIGPPRGSKPRDIYVNRSE